MTDEEWVRRFKDRIIERAGVSEEVAQGTFEGITVKEWREDSVFVDAPEDAADEEMSNWDDDGDS